MYAIVVEPYSEALTILVGCFALVGAISGLIILVGAIYLRYWHGFVEKLLLFSELMKLFDACAVLVFLMLNTGTSGAIHASSCIAVSVIYVATKTFSNIGSSTLVVVYSLINTAGKNNAVVQYEKAKLYFGFFMSFFSLCLIIGYIYADTILYSTVGCILVGKKTVTHRILAFGIYFALAAPQILGLMVFLATFISRFYPSDKDSDIYKWHQMFAILALSYFVTEIPFAIIRPLKINPLAIGMATYWSQMQNVFDTIILYWFIALPKLERQTQRRRWYESTFTESTYEVELFDDLI